MTFCFIFCAKHRGGVGIVSDRRVSIETKFDGWVPVHDDAVKFGLLHDVLGVATAGSVGTIRFILERLAQFPMPRKPSERLAKTARNILMIYNELIEADPSSREPEASAEFVLFDCYRRHGSRRFRLYQLRVRYDGFADRSVLDENYDRGRDWVAIGASQRVRQQLSACAIEDMRRFAQRKIRFRRLTEQEAGKLPSKEQGSAKAVSFRQEPGTSHPWRELETYRMLHEFGDARMDYASQLTAVASNAIHYEVKHLKERNFEEMQTISENQFTAVFHPAYGLRQSTPSFPT